MTKAYLLKGAYYLRYDVELDTADAGYPKPLVAGWSGLDGTGLDQHVDAVLDLGAGKAYFFSGSVYVRIDQQRNTVDGPVRSIAEAWAGMADAGFADGIDAAVNWGNGKAYMFRGDSYVRYDVAGDRVDDGYPLPTAEAWAGMADAGFADGIDAAVNWGNGKAYMFRGDSYVRYDVAGDRVEEGYPLRIAHGWAGLAEAGFADGIDAVWVKLATPP